MPIAHGRQERRGAEGAEGGWVRGGGIPSPVWEGSGKGAVPPPQKIFVIFLFQMVHFHAIWRRYFHVER